MVSSITSFIRKPSILKYLLHLSTRSLGGGDFALFLDNLIVHKTNDAMHLFEKLNITKNLNVPYCLQFNGIESYFSQHKAKFKKILLKCAINDTPYETNGLIDQSINSVNNKNATICVRYASA
jgi:hypothetical protein